MADLRFFVTKEGTLNKGGSGNDTIFTFTGIQSSDTIKGVDGNDLISFPTRQTHTPLSRSSSTIQTLQVGTLQVMSLMRFGAAELMKLLAF
jgi:Ca2+-binding RTX toxin-like protein